MSMDKYQKNLTLTQDTFRMSDFFSKFPIINYQGVDVRDISRRIAFVKTNLSDPLLFLPYTIEEGQKPEDVAFLYYGSVRYTWMVLLANEIMDPYTEWPLDSEDFGKMIISKYAKTSNRKGYDVIAWTQNEQITTNIVSYYKEDERGNVIYLAPGSDISGGGWTALRIYDWETQLNELRRNIQLVDTVYKDRIDAEFQKLITQ